MVPMGMGIQSAAAAISSIARAVGTTLAKQGLTMAAGYGADKAGEAMGLSQELRMLMSMGAMAATGLGVEAIDTKFNVSGYYANGVPINPNNENKPRSISISKEDLSDDILKTKPKNSPNPEKWLQKGGQISIDDSGTWTYTNSEGVSVKYTGGYPDFKEAGLVKQ